MEYIFGTNEYSGDETLRTKGPVHTDLTGFNTIVREYEDSSITDTFRVVRKVKSDDDMENNCYDWYVISNHNRIIDKTKPIQKSLTGLESTVNILLGVDEQGNEQVEVDK